MTARLTRISPARPPFRVRTMPARLATLAVFALAAFAAGGCGIRVLGRNLAAPGLAAGKDSAANETPKQEVAAKKSAKQRAANRSESRERNSRKSDAPKLKPLAEARAEAALAPREPYWPFHAAELLAAADSLPAAMESLRAALAVDRTYAPALSLYAKLCWDQGRHLDAVRLLDIVRREPGAFAADARRSLLAGLALHEDAIGDATGARATMPSEPGAARGEVASAMVYLTLRGATPDSAAALAAAALDASPKSAVHLNNHGIARLRAGDAEGARKAFLAAIDRNPGLAGPYYNLAILEKFYRFDDDAAVRWLAACRKRSAADPDSLGPALGREAQKDVAQKGN